MLYLQSNKDALIRARSGRRPEVFRVHTAGQPATSLTPFSTAGMHGGLAWVGYDQELMIGQLDPEVTLRWRACHIGDSPVEIAYHLVITPFSLPFLSAPFSPSLPEKCLRR
jgi:hypothetical protein